MRKRFALLLIFFNILLFFVNGSSQPMDNKSLQTVKHKAKDFNKLASYYLNQSVVKAKQYSDSAISLALPTGDYQQVAIGYNTIGKCFFMQNLLDSAEKYFHLSKQAARQGKFPLILYKATANEGMLKLQKRKYEQAISYFLDAKKILETDIAYSKTEYASLLENIGDAHFQSDNYSKAVDCFSESKQKYLEKKQVHQAAELSLKIGTAYYAQTKFNLALNNFQYSYQYFDSIQDLQNAAISRMNIGMIFQAMSKNFKALEIYKKSLEIFKNISYTEGIAKANYSIATLFVTSNEYDLAEEYFKNSLNGFRKSNNKLEQARVLIDYATMLKQKGEFEHALVLYIRVFEMQEQLNEQDYNIGITLLNIGELYSLQKKSSKAISYFEKALKIYQYLQNYNGIAKTIYYIGIEELRNKDYQKAIGHLQYSKNIADTIDNLDLSAKLFLALSDAYTETGNHKTALHFYKEYNTLTKLIKSTKYQNEIARLKAGFEVEKEMTTLKHAKTIKEKELNQQRKYKIVFVVGFIVISIFFGLLAFQFIKLKKAYNELVDRNLEIVKLENKLNFLSDAKKLHLLGWYGDENTEANKDSYKEIIKRLSEVMQKSKPYLKKDISLKQVAELIMTNRTYLSEAISNELNRNFNELINEYRVREARRLLSEKNDNHSIEAIANLVGFGSRSTFNSSFKKFTGVTPSYYRDSVCQRREGTEEAIAENYFPESTNALQKNG